MAVSKSPFSRNPKGSDTTTTTTTPRNRFKPNLNTDIFEDIRKMQAASSGAGSSSQDYVDIGTKTTLGEEKQKLDSAYNTALARIATSSMSEKQKFKARKQFQELYKTGKAETDDDFNPLNPFDVGRMQLRGLKTAGKFILDGLETVSRVSQMAYGNSLTNPIGIYNASKGKTLYQNTTTTHQLPALLNNCSLA